MQLLHQRVWFQARAQEILSNKTNSFALSLGIVVLVAKDFRLFKTLKARMQMYSLLLNLGEKLSQ